MVPRQHWASQSAAHLGGSEAPRRITIQRQTTRSQRSPVPDAAQQRRYHPRNRQSRRRQQLRKKMASDVRKVRVHLPKSQEAGRQAGRPGAIGFGDAIRQSVPQGRGVSGAAGMFPPLPQLGTDRGPRRFRLLLTAAMDPGRDAGARKAHGKQRDQPHRILPMGAYHQPQLQGQRSGGQHS